MPLDRRASHRATRARCRSAARAPRPRVEPCPRVRAGAVLDDDSLTAWRPAASDARPWLEFDLGTLREHGGPVVDFAGTAPLPALRLLASDDGVQWLPLHAEVAGNGRRRWLRAREAESRFVRLELPSGAGDGIARAAFASIELAVAPVRHATRSRDRRRAGTTRGTCSASRPAGPWSAPTAASARRCSAKTERSRWASRASASSPSCGPAGACTAGRRRRRAPRRSLTDACRFRRSTGASPGCAFASPPSPSANRAAARWWPAMPSRTRATRRATRGSSSRSGPSR